MDISVTEFKQRCLDIIRRVEERGESVRITRRGRVVARLAAARVELQGEGKPWERLQSMGGRCDFSPDESVLQEGDFEALR